MSNFCIIIRVDDFYLNFSKIIQINRCSQFLRKYQESGYSSLIIDNEWYQKYSLLNEDKFWYLFININ